MAKTCEQKLTRQKPKGLNNFIIVAVPNSPDEKAPQTPIDGADGAPDESPDELRINTAPNLLTLARVGFVPLVVAALFLRTETGDFIAALLFTIAAITDYFDGYLARVQKSVTVFGQLMDPLADKFLVAASLIMLQELGRIHAIVVMLLICREMAITGLRALASAEGVIIPASSSAKWKTATQMVAIPFLMLKQGLFGIPVYEVGMGLLYISLAISLWSARDYAADFFRELKHQRKKKALQRKLNRQAKRVARQERLLARLQRRPAP